jgi:soluble lytic murein transglycosylase-like protein
MKKLLLLTVFLLILMPSKKALAYEEPVAGITVTLDAVKDKPIEKAVAYYSAIYHVDSNLVLAVIDGESEGNPNAINKNRNGSTDHGLMQINSCNHEWLSKELGITDFHDPVQNIQAGTYILSLLTAKYDNYHRVLMAYNMGEKRTRELWRQGIRTSRYSRRVMEKYQRLKGGGD